MAGWVVPGGDGEADLVVQLRRCRDIAFLLNMESHAGWPELNAATLRIKGSGDNWVGVLEVMTRSDCSSGAWVQLEAPGGVPMRCWWSTPADGQHEKGEISTPNRVGIVLPEVFGVNAWVRSVADRLAADGVPALAIPLFSRTAPDLDLGYSDADLALGRSHKEATTADQILSDVAAAITWLGTRHPKASIGVVGFCFGGHAALLAATLAEVEVSVDFYGAGVSRMCPGGGPPSLNRLPQVQGHLIALCGTADPLIPPEDQVAIEAAFQQADPSGQRLRYSAVEGADHGFMCEARSSFHPQAAAQGWTLLRDALS